MALDVGKIFFEDQDVIAYSQLGIGRLIYQLQFHYVNVHQRNFDGKTPDEFDEKSLQLLINSSKIA